MDDQPGRRGAGRQEMRGERDEACRQNGPNHQEVLQDQHPSPSSCKRSNAKDLVARGVREVQFQPQSCGPQDQGSRLHGPPVPSGGGRRAPAHKAKPARDLSRRAIVVRNLTTAGTSAVGSSVASDTIHIAGNDEYTMTTIPSTGARFAAPIT